VTISIASGKGGTGKTTVAAKAEEDIRSLWSRARSALEQRGDE